MLSQIFQMCYDRLRDTEPGCWGGYPGNGSPVCTFCCDEDECNSYPPCEDPDCSSNQYCLFHHESEMEECLCDMGYIPDPNGDGCIMGMFHIVFSNFLN